MTENQILTSIGELKDLESSLRVSVEALEKRKKEKDVTQESIDTLKDNLAEYQAESSELSKTILIQKDDIDSLTKDILRLEDRIKAKMAELDKTELGASQKIEEMKLIVATKKSALDAELKGLQEKTIANSSKFVTEIEKSIAQMTADEAKHAESLRLIELYLTDKKEEKKIAKKEVDVLTGEKTSLEGHVKALQKKKDTFDITGADVIEQENKLLDMKSKVETLDEDIKNKMPILKDKETDLEIKDGWLIAKEKRIKNIAAAMAKKTQDPSILRMLNEL